MVSLEFFIDISWKQLKCGCGEELIELVGWIEKATKKC
jgi:hypothetical protein